MTARDFIIVAGVVGALPVWGYAVYNQWSGKPGATKRMLKACGLFAAILGISAIAALLAS